VKCDSTHCKDRGEMTTKLKLQKIVQVTLFCFWCCNNGQEMLSIYRCLLEWFPDACMSVVSSGCSSHNVKRNVKRSSRFTGRVCYTTPDSVVYRLVSRQGCSGGIKTRVVNGWGRCAWQIMFIVSLRRALVEVARRSPFLYVGRPFLFTIRYEAMRYKTLRVPDGWPA